MPKGIFFIEKNNDLYLETRNIQESPEPENMTPTVYVTLSYHMSCKIASC